MNSFSGFSILWGKKAVKEIIKINGDDQKKITDKVKELITNSESLDIKKLKNQEALFRLKVGNYRIIFEVDQNKKELFIARIGLRKSVYRNLEFAHT